MTVEQFIQSTVEGPGALSPEALAMHEARVAGGKLASVSLYSQELFH